MSGDIQVNAGESWLSHVPIGPSVTRVLLFAPQFAVSAIPVALSFEQSHKGSSRLYNPESHIGIKLVANVAVSTVCSVVRDALRALQVSSITSGYVWEFEHTGIEYLPSNGGGTDTTLGLGVDAARSFNNGPLALYGEKVWLNRVTIPNIRDSLQSMSFQVSSKKLLSASTYLPRIVADARADLQQQIGEATDIRCDQLRQALDFLKRLKVDLDPVEGAAVQAEDAAAVLAEDAAAVNAAAVNAVVKDLIEAAVTSSEGAEGGGAAANAVVEGLIEAAVASSEGAEGGGAAPVKDALKAAVKSVNFNHETVANDGTKSILKASKGDAPNKLSARGLVTLFRKILHLGPEDEVTSERIREAITEHEEELEEAVINTHLEQSVGRTRANILAHGARAEDYADRLGKLTKSEQELINAETRHSEITDQLAGETATPPSSALSTAFKVVEWGFNFLRLGYFLQDQLEYNERLVGLEKAYEKHTKIS